MKKSKKSKNIESEFEKYADNSDYFAQDLEENGAVSEKSAPPKNAKSKFKKSTALKMLSVFLFGFSFLIIIAVSLVPAVKSFNIASYYGFWPFLGTILIAILGVVFMIVVLTINRKKSKKSFRNQTICILITFFCLTTVFGLLLNCGVPDFISKQTQSTLFVDDFYTNGENQIKVNAALDRQFIRYNILNGNYDPQYSYYDLSKPIKTADGLQISGYENVKVDKAFKNYYMQPSYQIASIIESLSECQSELYNFISESYVLTDYDYAFNYSDLNRLKRKCFTLALFDQIYPVYDALCKEGFKNERMNYLRENNFKSMDQDGYKTFDDPLIIFAQIDGRRTAQSIIRLLLDDRFTYTTPQFDSDGNITGYDGYLFEGYAPQIRDEYVAKYGEIEDKAVDPTTGYIIHANGMVQRPMKWSVLDMDGNVMDVASLDLNSFKISGINFGVLLGNLLFGNAKIAEGIGELLDRDLTNIILTATNGAKLRLHIYIDDSGFMDISIIPVNVEMGMLGYQQMSWMNSNNLLFGIINLIGSRNTLFIYGAMGLVLVFSACLCREYSFRCKQEEKKSAQDLERSD